MVDFVKVRRRISYRDRMRMMRELLEKSEIRELTIRELVKKWQLTPTYIVKLMRWCAENYEHIEFDENYGILFYRSEVSPTFRSTQAQTQLTSTKEENSHG